MNVPLMLTLFTPLELLFFFLHIIEYWINPYERLPFLTLCVEVAYYDGGHFIKRFLVLIKILRMD